MPTKTTRVRFAILENATREPALALPLVRHPNAPDHNVGLDRHGGHASVAVVPVRELQPVRPPRYGAHVLWQRRLHARQKLHSVSVARHLVVRCIYVV
jgi:hypothetical protein